MMKDRREIRRKMKAEKKAMHRKEADWARETQLRKEQGQRVQCMEVNFHRPSGHDRWDPAWVPTIQVRRAMRGMDQQLHDFDDECESTSTDTCEVIVEHRCNRKPHKRIVMPRLGSMHYIEDLVNAREFGRAICDMRITRKEILAQKAGNV